MADVELVIKIPEETVNEIKDNAMFAKDIADNIKWNITSAIVNGAPLPKGHGDLKDVSDIEWAKFTRETSRYEEVKCVDWDVVENAPTIIEADKESEDRNDI